MPNKKSPSYKTTHRTPWWSPRAQRPIIILPLIIICFFLGLWQCFRLVEKNKIIDALLLNQQQPPLEWRGDNAPATLDDRGKKYVVAGEVLSHYIYIRAIAPDENEQRGYWVVMPLKTKGEVLLVVLGFYPETVKRNITADKINEDLAEFYQNLSPQQKLVVYADPIQTTAPFVPDNNLGSDIWFLLKPDQLAEKWQLNVGAEKFLFKSSAPPQFIKPTDVPLRYFSDGLALPYNQHLQYIATWWLLAIFGFLFYWFGGKKIVKKKKHV